MNKEKYIFHITYEKGISLNKLINLLSIVNMSFNDHYRNNGINNNTIGSYAPVVEKVESGSILLDVGVTVLSGLTTKVLAELILQRIRKPANTNSKKGEAVNNIQINAGDNNTINIHIGNDQ